MLCNTSENIRIDFLQMPARLGRRCALETCATIGSDVMTDSTITRANLIAQMVSDDSVTTDLLADDERDFPDGRLVDEAPISYLDESESPAFLLTNSKKGIGLGTKNNTVSPDSDRGTVVMITGRRTICLVGQEDGDETYSIPHDAVAWASYHTGFFSNRLELRTPAKGYHCWADRATSEQLLEDITEYIDERTSSDPTPIAGDAEACVYSWRGDTVNTAEESAETRGNGD